MPNLDINSATTTNFEGTVSKVTISPVTPDQQGTQEEIPWDFPDADKHNSYYQIPEIRSLLSVYSQRLCGLGYDCSPIDRVILEHVSGTGEDTFTSILRQAKEEAKIFGDSFTEIVTDEESEILVNLKRLYTGNMRLVRNPQGLIERYELRSNTPGGKNIKFKPEQILHFTNSKVGSEIHGTSIALILKKILDAKNQALDDEITIRHRDKALGIVYYDTDDAGKISYANSQIEKAVNKGEMVGLPKDTALIEAFPSKPPSDRIGYLQYLDNLFYQVGGIPKVLVTSEGFTEAGGKAGLLAFEPNEISEKVLLEEQLWNQLGIRIKFKRAPSLLGDAVGTEQKNAGQTGIQPNETEVRPTRTE